MTKKRANYYLDEAVIDRLKAFCKETGRIQSAFVERAVTDALDSEEEEGFTPNQVKELLDKMSGITPAMEGRPAKLKSIPTDGETLGDIKGGE
jgi:predicted DNA-binding protein